MLVTLAGIPVVDIPVWTILLKSSQVMVRRIELGAIDEQVTSTDAKLPVFGMFLPTLFSIATYPRARSVFEVRMCGVPGHGFVHGEDMTKFEDLDLRTAGMHERE